MIPAARKLREKSMRLMNTTTNPLIGLLPRGIWQSGVYSHGQPFPPGLEGGIPSWVIAEFNAVAGFDTQDGGIVLPDDFTMLAILARSSQPEEFAIQLYDVDDERWIMDKMMDKRLLTGAPGNAASPSQTLFLTAPYDFKGANRQIFVRVINQSPNANNAMVVLYGTVGGAKV